jgi:hypothetical protein
MKRHGCMLTYLLYVFLYFIWFFVVGKILSGLSLKVSSDDLLAITLFLSFVLAALTAVIITKRKQLAKLFHPEKY